MDVAVAFYAGDFAAEPIWRLKLSTRRAIWEFHFSHDEAFVFPTIDVDLDYEISPRNFVARLLQPPADRSGPEHGELFRTQFDLAFVADISAHKFEGERQVAAFFSKPHMSIVRLGDEITLRDFEISSAFQIRRQTFDQKLPFDLAIIFLIHSFERCCQPISVKMVLLAIAASLLLSSCGWFGPMEKHRTEAGRTTFRSAEESPAESEPTPSPQKIPGER